MLTSLLITLVVLALSAAAEPVVASNGSAVYEAVSDAVVRVGILDDRGGYLKSSGSGVAITRNKIVTNCHVIARAERISVTQYLQDSTRRVVEAERIAGDSRTDLCVLRTEHSLHSLPVRIGTAAATSVGDDVYALGMPREYMLTLSKGILSQFRRCRNLEYFGSCPTDLVLQFDAAISPGSSGGGLFNTDAELIGITTYKDIRGDGLFFAIPADWIKEIVNYEKVLSDNAIFYARKGKLREAEQIAKQMKNRCEQVKTLFRAADEIADRSNKEGAQRMIAATKSIVRKLDDDLSCRASLLRRIAVLQHRLGEPATDIIKEAWDSVRLILKPGTRAAAMVRMSYPEALIGNCDGAREAQREAQREEISPSQRKRMERLIAFEVRRIEKKTTCKMD